jgi:hypothetical protein
MNQSIHFLGYESGFEGRQPGGFTDLFFPAFINPPPIRHFTSWNLPHFHTDVYAKDATVQ